MLKSVLLAIIFACSTAAAATFETLSNFPGSPDGANPSSPLINVDGELFGTAHVGGKYFLGTVFRFNPSSGLTSTVYGFTGADDGAGPTNLTNIGRALYGTFAPDANYNGPNSYGGVFRIDLTTGVETTLYGFSGGADGSRPNKVVAAGNQLYGTTQYGGAQGGGTIFKLDPVTGKETVLHAFGGANDGNVPAPDLFASGNYLYGSTYNGGTNGTGILYRIDTTTGAETIIRVFTDTDHISGRGYAQIGHNLYGTMSQGGASNLGAIFEVNDQTGIEKTLYSFTGGRDGANPLCGLTISGGMIYGISESLTTAGGGLFTTGGTIFSYDPNSGAFNTVADLPQENGVYPDGQLSPSAMLDVHGILYGSNVLGGPANQGTLFSVAPATGELKLLHSFVGLSSYNGNSGLTALHGGLYGATQQGGAAALGNIVRVNPQTGDFRSVHDFTGGADGFAPTGPLYVSSQLIYGSTVGDNASTPHGTAFELDDHTGALTTLNSFVNDTVPLDGPNSGVVKLGAGIYGTTISVTNGFGTIYRIPSTSSDKIRSLSLQNVGGDSIGGLTVFQGALYGTTFAVFGVGQVFKLDPVSFTLSTIYSFNGGNDGEYPYAGVIGVGRNLYGTTLFGGSSSLGTVFQINIDTQNETVLHSFTGGQDGAYASEGLVAVGNILYGMTGGGGATSNGTIFSIDTATGAYTVLFSFGGGADGSSPAGRLVQLGSALYGTTSLGGAANRGTVFKLTP